MLGARFNKILTLCPLKSTVLAQGEGCWSHFVVGNFLLFMDLFLILTHTHTHIKLYSPLQLGHAVQLVVVAASEALRERIIFYLQLCNLRTKQKMCR